MEHLRSGLTLEIPMGAFPLSTDTMALAHFARLPKNARVLDLGSGCGTLGLLLCGRDPGCSVTGVEIDPVSHEGAMANIARNGLGSRMESLCADLRQLPLSPGSFDVCLSNPPYFSGGPASRESANARREDLCSLEELIRTAAKAVKYGGDFFLVHKPERLGQICALGGKYGLEAKRLCSLRHRSGGPVSLILVALRKGARPGLVWEEMCLYGPDGAPTEDYRAIYHFTAGNTFSRGEGGSPKG